MTSPGFQVQLHSFDRFAERARRAGERIEKALRKVQDQRVQVNQSRDSSVGTFGNFAGVSYQAEQTHLAQEKAVDEVVSGLVKRLAELKRQVRRAKKGYVSADHSAQELVRRSCSV